MLLIIKTEGTGAGTNGFFQSLAFGCTIFEVDKSQNNAVDFTSYFVVIGVRFLKVVEPWYDSVDELSAFFQ